MNVDRTMDGMAECVKSSLTRTVGVSNFNQTQMLAAYSALARQNIPLASNQVHYSLLNREVEKNGLLARCMELGIRLIAYSPLEKGLLTGKYDANNRPPGTRGGMFSGILPKLEPLLKLMTTIGQDHGGKSNSQVALNWVTCKGALPIPGAKNANQAQENAGALGWKLTEEEVSKLDEMSDGISG
jgi:aryl-alcohol dehydrogenase-like predicted oxidoreductase